MTLNARRRWFQAGFFALFILAPPLDLFRLDLTLGHFILFGQDWTLGLDDFLAGNSGPADAVWNILWRGFLPIALVIGGGIYAAWRWGRLYCGWLCPHFSVVELINTLMIKASGKPSVWEKKALPNSRPDSRWWPLTWLAALFFAFLWALALLTYLLPPAEIYGNLLNAELTPNQFRFLAVATLVLFIEFLFARHLFCRFGCAIGLFQSLAWMANDRALVVGFHTHRADECSRCGNACDDACPMRLKPRTIKRRMFTCTECTQCIQACDRLMAENPQGGLLDWVQGDRALPVAGRRENGKQRERN